jgi:NAD(P)-dependent dehydrogenase (short-subunit alcohol dehydrogenase family)
MTLLTALVSERTGYPLDMLGADLDLEADLSIDSIKRLEILGELTERAGMAGAAGPGESLDESIVEELVAQKSLRAIVTWVQSHLGIEEKSSAADAGPGSADPTPTGPTNVGSAPTDSETVSPAGALTAPPSDVPDPIPDSTVRAVFRAVPAPPAGIQGDALTVNGHGLAVVDDGRGIAPLVVSLLGSHGVPARVVEPHAIPDNSGGIVHMGLLFPGSQTAADVFEQVHPAAVAGAGALVAVTGLGGTHGRCMVDDRGSDRSAAEIPRSGSGGMGRTETQARARAQTGQFTGAGVAGLWRALARERPDAHVRAVDLDPADDPVVLAGHVVAEVLASGGPVAVGYRHGERCTVIAAEEALDGDPADRRSPAAHSHPIHTDSGHNAPGTDLSSDSVVLLTGGARGITARLAISLASTYGCSLELVGRSPLPSDPEDPEVTAAADATELRRVLIARGEREPAAIESSVARLLAAREIRSNLTALDNAGVKVSYHAVDVRDADALRGVVDSVYDRHGRLDGIVHGAGVIEDRLLADKTPESFRRVFDTKVGAAHTLVGAVREPHPFLVLFTSVSGAFGNKGQVDYAAANDALATLAWSLDAQQFGPVVAVDWGPWAGSGMVTPQLDREYARRGVGLVHPDEGVTRLLDELRMSLPEPEIVLARARVSTFEAPSGPIGRP